MTVADPSAGGRIRAAGLPAAVALEIVTVALTLCEAVLGLLLGARAASLALSGFGLDSVIETASACVVLAHVLRTSRGACEEDVAASERKAHRTVGALFLLLAAWIVWQAGAAFLARRAPHESAAGIALAVGALVVMPALAWGKMHAARVLGSPALLADARQSLACAWLAAALLVGLAAHRLLGWWWADPAAALVMVPFMVHEGLEPLLSGSSHH